MSTEIADAMPLAPKLRGQADEPWAVIVAAVAGVFLLQFFRAPSEDQQIDVFEMQARALVGGGAWGRIGTTSTSRRRNSTAARRPSACASWCWRAS